MTKWVHTHTTTCIQLIMNIKAKKIVVPNRENFGGGESNLENKLQIVSRSQAIFRCLANP